MTEVLLGAFEHQIKIPPLPELIQRLTASMPLRCACVESTEDHRTALCHEMKQHFGVKAVPVPTAEIRAQDLEDLEKVEGTRLPSVARE